MIVVTVFEPKWKFHLVQKLSPRSYPIHCERKWKYSFFSVAYCLSDKQFKLPWKLSWFKWPTMSRIFASSYTPADLLLWNNLILVSFFYWKKKCIRKNAELHFYIFSLHQQYLQQVCWYSNTESQFEYKYPSKHSRRRLTAARADSGNMSV